MRWANVIMAVCLTMVPVVTVAQNVVVDEPAVCYQCHPEMEDLQAKKSVHAAFADGKCSACHNPHASRHATLLNEDTNELCLTCHEAIDQKKRHSAVVHEPVDQGKCISCHDPHASDYPNHLKEPTEKLCQGCHRQVSDWLGRENVHPPVADFACMSCHAPHGSKNEALLTKSVPKLCFGCHDRDNNFRQAHSGYDVAEANCVTCHDPHASSLPSLLMPNQHPPFKAKKCRACHTSGGGSNFALKGNVEEVCTRCHSNIKKIAAEPYAHNLTDSLACLHCHNPHASSTNTLLAAPQSVTCLKCHFKGPEYAEKTPEQILTHDGMDCTNCHQPHGSPTEHFFAREGIALCTGCHEDAHKGSHPLGPDVIDPRTKKPMTCLSCHQLHGAKFKPYLPLSPDMDLCIQCHRR
ncbi:MAG: hypothetical protein D6800_10210 [Candidatus Zixiibacteriota bacterium]|nr:MAG: hypothetical protein D6800_10210 [candidate division Zixibacteria bacterium]